MTVITFLNPLVAVALGVGLLGEPLTLGIPSPDSCSSSSAATSVDHPIDDLRLSESPSGHPPSPVRIGEPMIIEAAQITVAEGQQSQFRGCPQPGDRDPVHGTRIPRDRSPPRGGTSGRLPAHDPLGDPSPTTPRASVAPNCSRKWRALIGPFFAEPPPVEHWERLVER